MHLALLLGHLGVIQARGGFSVNRHANRALHGDNALRIFIYGCAPHSLCDLAQTLAQS